MLLFLQCPTTEEHHCTLVSVAFGEEMDGLYTVSQKTCSSYSKA